jgi:hypothetical protein
VVGEVENTLVQNPKVKPFAEGAGSTKLTPEQEKQKRKAQLVAWAAKVKQ